MNLKPLEITQKLVAIVCFGPLTEVSGTRPGAFYQVTIDPSMVSPDGEFIRFGNTQGDEITGWQRIDNMTICSKLTDGELELPLYTKGIEMRIAE